MYCKNCGKEIPNDAKFCPNCGAQTDQLAKTYIIKEQIEKKPEKYKSGLGLAIVTFIISFSFLFIYEYMGVEDLYLFHLGITSGFYIPGFILSLIGILKKRDLGKCYTAMSFIIVSTVLILSTLFYNY